MIRLTLLALMVVTSLAHSLLDSETTSDEYADDDPLSKKGVFPFLLSLLNWNKHSLPKDWSIESDHSEKPYSHNLRSLYDIEDGLDSEHHGSDDQDQEAEAEPSHLNLRQSLTLWEIVERKIKNILTRRRGQRTTLKDRSTHTAAVMSSVLGLAAKLLETCSTIEYVKSYRGTVASNLLQAYANPAETTNTLLDLLEKIKKSIANARTLIQRKLLPCKQTDYKCPSSPLLLRQQELIRALGSFARTYLASISLQKAINSYDEVAYLLNGEKDQALYVLTVKSARVLKLMSNSYTCELPLESKLPRLTYDDSSENVNHVTLKHRYPILIG
ncbi:uncharacterized protein LOC128670113 [Plodia interpunctella]|uniref:uncharacterized protein LOC128670113 n=1 Tax=Plodia interpunctella TaxID=58824 RepID=UPI00236897AB|nr:uncharacterized protein LOC128670113 [Plodia interpunctella]